MTWAKEHHHACQQRHARLRCKAAPASQAAWCCRCRLRPGAALLTAGLACLPAQRHAPLSTRDVQRLRGCTRSWETGQGLWTGRRRATPLCSTPNSWNTPCGLPEMSGRRKLAASAVCILLWCDEQGGGLQRCLRPPHRRSTEATPASAILHTLGPPATQGRGRCLPIRLFLLQQAFLPYFTRSSHRRLLPPGALAACSPAGPRLHASCEARRPRIGSSAAGACIDQRGQPIDAWCASTAAVTITAAAAAAAAGAATASDLSRLPPTCHSFDK